MESLVVWVSQKQNGCSRRVLEGPHELTCSGVQPLDRARCHDARHPLILPLGARGTVLAACLVPEGCEGEARLGARPLESGLHLLRHADRLERRGALVWISACAPPQRTTFDPARHGAGSSCARTRAALRAGEDIVICPGRPGAPCGRIHRADAWDDAVPCSFCGFDARGGEWQPPLPTHRRSLDDIFQLLRPRP